MILLKLATIHSRYDAYDSRPLVLQGYVPVF